MTEEEWMKSEDLLAMDRFVETLPGSHRKRHLLSAAIKPKLLDYLFHSSSDKRHLVLNLILLEEQCAEGLTAEIECDEAYNDVVSEYPPSNIDDKELLPLLRDIFGNPFRPITLNPLWLTPTVKQLPH